MSAEWLTTLERGLAEGEEEELATALVALAYWAGREIEIPEPERRAAARRALLLLASGGDPARGLDLEGRAVTALAAELETAERRSELLTGLGGLMTAAAKLDHVSAAVRALVNDSDVAWRAYAAAVLADEIDR
jgi:hypothetical protein